MSALTQCNFCDLRDIRRWAEKKGQVVHLVDNKPDGPGNDDGVTALVCRPDETPTHADHFVAWFMELPDKCACNS